MNLRTLCLLVGLITALIGEAQDQNVVLGRLSEATTDEERLVLCAKAARKAADALDWEEAADLAIAGLTNPQVDHVRGPASTCSMVLAECELQKGSAVKALPHALRSVAYANENDREQLSHARLLMARIHEQLELPARSLDYALQADAAGGLSGADRVMARRLIARGRAATGDMDGALAAYREMIPQAVGLQDKELIVECMGTYAALEAERGRFLQAREMELALLRTLSSLPGGPERGIVLNNLGELSERLGEDSVALDYFGEAGTWLHDTPALYERTLMNISIAYGRKGLLTPARYAIDNAMASMQKRGAPVAEAEAHNVKAGLYILDGSYADAEHEVREALALAGENGPLDVRIASYELLKRIARDRGLYLDVQHAENELKNLQVLQAEHERRKERQRSEFAQLIEKQERDLSASITNEQRDRARVREALLDAENKAKELGLLRYEKQLQESALREEGLAREKAQQALRLMEARLASERQENDLRALRDERSLQMLELNKLDLERKQKETSMAMLKRQNELLEKDRELKEAGHRRDAMMNRFALTAAAVLAALVVFCLWAIRKVKGKNRVINTHVDRIKGINSQLAQRNADLMSSITCAQNIQRSIVPTEERLRALLPDSFLYYRPRDIVSGDLPFVREVDGRLFVATIDCTGHGVPAAMLSFMAYYNLNDIINTHEGMQVNDILFTLHERIRCTVHQNMGSDLSEGMDISLVEVDLARRVIQFSGAQNSIVLVRNGECTRVLGDRCSIGDRLTGQCNGFGLHRIEMQPMDQVYLYSDGLVHQFGGERGLKKFGNQRLMETVRAQQRSTARDTAIEVTRVHEEWKGRSAQTDDILLIGFSLDQHTAVKAA